MRQEGDDAQLVVVARLLQDGVTRQLENNFTYASSRFLYDRSSIAAAALQTSMHSGGGILEAALSSAQAMMSDAVRPPS